jgi:hypothetical protein
MRALSTDFLLREQFITDPAGMLSEYVGRKTISTEARDAANQLVFAVVSNPRVLDGLRQRVTTLGSAGPVQVALANALAKAVGEHPDPAIAASLIRAGAIKQAPIGPALDLLGAITVAGRTAGQGNGHRPGTESTMGVAVTGTESTMGVAVTGTESTMGVAVTGTESTMGVAVTGTESTMGVAVTGTQSTMGVAVTGTESTMGVAVTGTESTMGVAVTGTESTFGVAVGQGGEMQVLLQSLVEYASQLRRAGVLDQTGFE